MRTFEQIQALLQELAAELALHVAQKGTAEIKKVMPSPWPIDTELLSEAELAALTREESNRANAWQLAKMSAGAIGNGDPAANLRAAFWGYKAPWTKSADIQAPLDATWQAIWIACVKQPLPVWKSPDAAWERVNQAYRDRAAQAAPQPAAPAPGPTDVDIEG